MHGTIAERNNIDTTAIKARMNQRTLPTQSWFTFKIIKKTRRSLLTKEELPSMQNKVFCKAMLRSLIEQLKLEKTATKICVFQTYNNSEK